MSRIRLLNLPPSVTEAALTKHFQTAKLPPSAPALVITDCSIKRGYGGSDGSKALVRMAFIGFKTAAAGQFAVKHFNGSYFGSAKIGVELATGLQDTAVVSTRSRQSAAVSGAAASMTMSQPANKKRRGEGEGMDPAEAAAPTSGDSTQDAKKQEFVASRIAKNSGPTWASEMMLPPAPAAGLATATATALLLAPTSSAVPLSAEEQESAAFRRQTALDGVDDMDFLASIEAKPDAPTLATAGDKRPRDEDAAENDGTEDAPAGGAVGAPTRGNVAGTIGWGDQAWNDGSDDPSIARRTRRVRFGNLPYAATEEDVKNFASSKVGPVLEVHLPVTKDTKQSKGAAFVKFAASDDAVAALAACQGAIFMGRLLRVSAAEEDPHTAAREAIIANINLAERIAAGGGAPPGSAAGGGKRQSEFQAEKLKAKKLADGQGASWNSAYVSSHAAVESIAKRLGTTGGDLVNVSSQGAAVRAAISEAFITSEAKKVLSDEGIDFSALESGQTNIIKNRSNTTILVKNLTPACDYPALVKLFGTFGALESTAIPDSAGFALFGFVHAQDARRAFERLAYKKFSGAPLFLEWAPVGSIRAEALEEADGADAAANGDVSSPPTGQDRDGEGGKTLQAKTAVHTLFLSNLPFQVTQQDVEQLLTDACPRLVGEAGWKRHVQRLALQSTKGWAFLTVMDEAAFRYVQTRLQGKSVKGRLVTCQAAKANATAADAEPTKAAAAAADGDAGRPQPIASRQANASHAPGTAPPGCNPVKLIVKNLPFEATEADLRELFAAFTEVKAVRVPKKLNQFGTAAHRSNNHRGFGFVEFLTAQEATNALKALSATHLYGRHLVLQYAKMEDA